MSLDVPLTRRSCLLLQFRSVESQYAVSQVSSTLLCSVRTRIVLIVPLLTSSCQSAESIEELTEARECITSLHP